MIKFAYVFSEEDKVKMLDAGYVLMYEDPKRKTFVFQVGTEVDTGLNVVAYYSSVLPF